MKHSSEIFDITALCCVILLPWHGIHTLYLPWWWSCLCLHCGGI